MNTPKILERRAFLASSAATVVAGVAGCEGTDDGGTKTDTTDSSNSTDPSSTTPTTASSTTPTESSTTTTGPGSTTAPASTTGEPSSTTTASSSETLSRESSGGGASSVDDVSSRDDLSSSVDVAGSSDVTSSEGPPPADDACFEGGGTDGGLADDAGAGVLCSTNTDNGNHCHALVVPQSDATSGFAEATYTLEDGGTGHTHTVTITAYDFFYLEAGIPHSLVSTEEAGHVHVCQFSCPPS